MMYELMLDTARCKGCGFCISACPRKALSLSDHFNKQGIQVIEANEELCVKCGVCYTVCPDYVFKILNVKNEGEEV